MEKVSPSEKPRKQVREFIEGLQDVEIKPYLLMIRDVPDQETGQKSRTRVPGQVQQGVPRAVQSPHRRSGCTPATGPGGFESSPAQPT